MPLYEYECSACQHRFELIQRFSDAPVDTCPACGSGPVQKLLSAPAIQFKGTGWYVTDYAGKKGGSDSSDSSSSSDSTTKIDSTTKTDSAPASSSTESKTTTEKPSSASKGSEGRSQNSGSRSQEGT